MNNPGSLLDELRVRYEAVQESTDDHADVESFEAIDARLRDAFRWLEKAITYLNGLKPPIEHRFDLGYGYAFDSPRFAHGSVGQHERRIRGYPVLEQIDVYYEISASKPLSIEVVPGWVSFAEKTLDAFGLQYSCRRVEDSDGTLSKCIFSVPPVIPARVSCRVDYRTGIVTVALVNVDRLERVTLEFPEHRGRGGGARRPRAIDPRPRLGIPEARATRRVARSRRGLAHATCAECQT